MAGSWGALVYRKGYLNGAYVPLHGLEKEFTADAADGSIPVETVDDVSGWLCGVDIVSGVDFEVPETGFDALSLAVQTRDGVEIIATTAALTASGRLLVEPPMPFADGLKLVPTGNTTVNAKGKIIPLVSPA